MDVDTKKFFFEEGELDDSRKREVIEGIIENHRSSFFKPAKVRSNLMKLVKLKKKLVRIIYFMKSNYTMKRNLRTGIFSTKSGSLSMQMNVQAAVTYVNTVVEDYMKIGNISKADIKGKTILELGPGDNLGVALSFLLLGAKKVICLDRFYSSRPQDWERQIYKSILARFPGKEELFAELIDLNKGVKFNKNRLQYIYGTGIEEADKIFPRESFDIILSRAVLEHVYDPDEAFACMDKMLTKHGTMLHVIDLGDHGMFSGVGLHPLTFLTLPDGLWKMMSSHSGQPNRRLVSYYEKKLAKMNYDEEIFVTSVLGSENRLSNPKKELQYGIDYFDSTLSLIKEIRPHLKKTFRNISELDLMKKSIVLKAKKRGRTSIP